MKKTTIATVPLALFVLLISVSSVLTQENGDRPRAALFAPSTPEVVSVSNNPSSYPVMGLDANGAAYIVWMDVGLGRTFMFATNASGEWTTPATVERILGPAEWAGDPALAVAADGACHLTFQDSGVTSPDVFYLSRAESGWSKLTNICFNAGLSGYSSLAINPVDNTLFAVWMDSTVATWEIYLKYRSAAGAWSSIQTVPVGFGYAPDISIDARGTAHLVWETLSGGNSAVYYSKNANPQNPSQWTAPLTIRASTSEDDCEPRVRSDASGNAYIIWRDRTQGDDEFFFREVFADGRMSDEVNVSQTVGSSQGGVLAVNETNGHVFVAWSENEESLYINAYAETWSGPVQITTGEGPSYQPSIAVDAADVVHLTYVSLTGRVAEILHRTVTGGGQPTTTTTSVPADPSPPEAFSLGTRLDDFPNKKINTLSWHRSLLNQDIPLDGYRIYRKAAGEPDSAFGLLIAVPADFFQYEDRDLAFSQVFAYAVSAQAQGGKESVRTDMVAEDGIYPPRNTQVKTIANRSLSFMEKLSIVTWQESPLNQPVAVSGYNIYRRSFDAEGPEYELIGTVEPGVFSFSDRRVPRDRKFLYVVTAVDPAGRESRTSDPAYEES